MNPHDQYPSNEKQPMQNPQMPNNQYSPDYAQQYPPMNQYPPQGYYPPQGQYPPGQYPPMGQYPPNMQGQPQGNYVIQQAFVPHKEKIMGLEGIFVKQKIDLMEMLSGCEMENKYLVYRKEPGKVKKMGGKLYKCKEKSGCYTRQCLSNDCRPLKIQIENLGSNDNYDKECMVVERPCTCTFLCFNRPYSKIYYTEDGSNQYIGKISDPWDCCNYSFSVYDKHDKKAFSIFTTCCQCAMCCKGCPCEPCERVTFQVFDPAGTLVTTIEKKNKNCIQNALTDADNFGMDFPSNFDWETRSLFLVAMMFIDFMMFEEKKGGQHHYD